MKRGVGKVQAKAITETVFEVRKELQGSMVKSFDRPTPFTKRSLIVVKATVQRPIGVVKVQPKQAEYLYTNVVGGVRKPPLKWIIIPDSGTRRNQYGNLTKAARTKLFTDPKNKFREVNPSYAVILRKIGGKDRIIARLKKATKYKPRWDFYGDARKSAERIFPREWNKQMARLEAGKL